MDLMYSSESYSAKSSCSHCSPPVINMAVPQVSSLRSSTGSGKHGIRSKPKCQSLKCYFQALICSTESIACTVFTNKTSLIV